MHIAYTITFVGHLAGIPSVWVAPTSSTSSFPRAACSHCYLSGICRYTDAHHTAGVTKMMCSDHTWVFQVCNGLVQIIPKATSTACKAHTARLYCGKSSMDWLPWRYPTQQGTQTVHSMHLGLTPCACSCGQHTTVLTTVVLHRQTMFSKYPTYICQVTTFNTG